MNPPPPAPPRPLAPPPRVRLWHVGVALVLIAAALPVDPSIANWTRAAGIERWLNDKSHIGRTVSDILKIPGEARAAVVVALLAVFLHPARWRAGALIAIAASLSGTNTVFKWVVGRSRPFRVDGQGPFDLQPFRDGVSGFFRQANLSFPSGHTAEAVAVAAAVGMLWPRLRYPAFAIAAITAGQRVLSNSHYFSEAVAGAALGLACAAAASHIVARLHAPTTSPPAP